MPTWDLPRKNRFSRRRQRHLDGSIRYDDPRTMKSVRYEDVGTVDGANDRDSGNPNAIVDDAACVIPWVRDGYEAIEVYVDPAIDDRTTELCSLVSMTSGTTEDLDTLVDTVFRYTANEGLSASVYEQLPDDLTTGVVAIAVTAG